MKIHRKIEYSLIIAFIVFALALFVKFIPCQTAPVVPNPTYTWTLCDLNPDQTFLLGITKNYFGLFTSIKQADLALMIGVFLISLLIMSLITRKKQ